MRITIEEEGRVLLEIGEDQTVRALPGGPNDHAACLDALGDALAVLAGATRGRGQDRGAAARPVLVS